MQRKELGKLIYEGEKTMRKLLVNLMVSKRKSLKSLRLTNSIKRCTLQNKKKLIEKFRKRISIKSRMISISQKIHNKTIQMKIPRKNKGQQKFPKSSSLEHRAKKSDKQYKMFSIQQVFENQKQMSIQDLLNQYSSCQRISQNNYQMPDSNVGLYFHDNFLQHQSKNLLQYELGQKCLNKFYICPNCQKNNHNQEQLWEN